MLKWIWPISEYKGIWWWIWSFGIQRVSQHDQWKIWSGIVHHKSRQQNMCFPPLWSPWSVFGLILYFISNSPALPITLILPVFASFDLSMPFTDTAYFIPCLLCILCLLDIASIILHCFLNVFIDFFIYSNTIPHFSYSLHHCFLSFIVIIFLDIVFLIYCFMYFFLDTYVFLLLRMLQLFIQRASNMSIVLTL